MTYLPLKLSVLTNLCWFAATAVDTTMRSNVSAKGYTI
ncbi:hypothetical protein BVRB_7g174940 [Beta vulgaris subsp. vulgaris]|nr:hypothetical protein BVRB_7g174940 [Beta vulgaris subsp. vulgaris]